ncbi:hypothetical protein OIU78_022680 [Salix suchowensis]|nr:hypothetical protein OIU78_022680 [Salix suchowensis]
MSLKFHMMFTDVVDSSETLNLRRILETGYDQSHSFVLWLGLEGNFYWRLELHTFEKIEIPQGLFFVNILMLFFSFEFTGKAIVIMGVSGAGKSTIGELLAKALDCSFLDADDFHPQSNKDKMHQGIPLTEEDRIPWLEILQDALRESLISGKTVVLSCSALQKRYREILRSADCNYHHDGSFKSAVKVRVAGCQGGGAGGAIR